MMSTVCADALQRSSASELRVASGTCTVSSLQLGWTSWALEFFEGERNYAAVETAFDTLAGFFKVFVRRRTLATFCGQFESGNVLLQKLIS